MVTSMDGYEGLQRENRLRSTVIIKRKEAREGMPESADEILERLQWRTMPAEPGDC